MANSKAYQKAYYEAHKEELRAKGRAYNATHRKERKAYLAANRERAKPIRKAWQLQKRYGLTMEAFEAMLRGQGGLCAICKQRLVVPHIDHDHSSGAVRGILCKHCNSAIGLLGDNPDLVLAALTYLRENGA